jgi:hypothetical protein
MKTLTNLLLIPFIASSILSQSQQKRDELIIPMDVSSQRPIVEVTIGKEGPYKFIFDTGSSGNIIDSDLAGKLKLKIVGEDPLGTPGGPSKMVSKRVEASNINFAGINERFKTELNTIPLRQMLPADGIISPALFSDYLVTINYPESKLILTKGTLNADDKGVVSFKQEIRIINVQINVDGNAIEAHLDSGNPGFFAIPFDLKDKLTFKQEPVEDGMIQTPGAEFKKWMAQLDGYITVGDIVFKEPKVHLVEGFSVVNLGYGFLNETVTTIDRKSNLIQFSQSISRPQPKKPSGEGDNQYVGWYGGGVRQVIVEDGQLFIQRKGGPKLKLELINNDYYEMTFSMPAANELPKVRFERSADGQVTGLTFVFTDGREDFAKKD